MIDTEGLDERLFVLFLCLHILKSKIFLNLEILIYDHCSHLIFPESMVKLLLPGLLVDLILPRFYSEAKGFVKECRRSRIDLDEHIQSTIKEWITV